jgi:L-aspartate oxidase
VLGRRAALAGLDEPPPDDVPPGDAAPIEPPSRTTREAVWRLAGLERTAPDLEQLAADPHPLARLVAVSALTRRETRGAHARAEFPAPDPVLDGRHSVIAASANAPAFASWE